MHEQPFLYRALRMRVCFPSGHLQSRVIRIARCHQTGICITYGEARLNE